MSYDWAMETYAAGLRELCEVAESSGVAVLVEPQPWHLIQTTGQYEDIARRVCSPVLGLSLDVASVYCMGEPLTDTIRRMAPATRHYHIEDVDADRSPEPVVPGWGTLDLGAVLKAIRSTRYEEWLTLQLPSMIEDPDGAGAESKLRLEWADRG